MAQAFGSLADYHASWQDRQMMTAVNCKVEQDHQPIPAPASEKKAAYFSPLAAALNLVDVGQAAAEQTRQAVESED